MKVFLLLSLSVTVVQSTDCAARCQQSGCHGCLASNNICDTTTSKSDCFAHSWCWCEDIPCTGTSSSISQQDCRAWQAFHDGFAWGSQSNCTENRNTPCDCNYRETSVPHFGVTCEGVHITALRFSFNHLVGTLSSEISGFTDLEHLIVDVNNISGTIPAAIANLPKLKGLWLNCNDLSGKVPPLPFAQYAGDAHKGLGCWIGDLPPSDPHHSAACYELNHFECPLPANASQGLPHPPVCY
jgi:hypothetical protein